MGQLVRSVAAARKASTLFKTFKSVKVRFNPFDPDATTAREFLRRVRTAPVMKNNPELEVQPEVVESYGDPSIQITYNDGETQKIEPVGATIAQLIDEVERLARWKVEGASNPFGELRERRAKEKN